MYRCISKFPNKCGEAIVKSVLSRGGTVDDKYCCEKLVSMGRDCHEELVKKLVSLPEVPAVDVFQVSKRGEQVWQKCASLIK